MKFLCVECDAQMASVGQRAPGDGTLGILFRCPRCEREIAMLANAMETQMVSSLCVHIGGRSGDREEPFEMVRSRLEPGGEPGADGPGSADAPEAAPDTSPSWSGDAETRLERVPGFVRPAVRRMYADWARERGIEEITPEVMDRARSDLDFDGM